MSDASFLRELFKIDQEAKKQHEDKLFAAYVNGKVKIGDSLFTLCLNDPILYGNLVKRIQDHKKSQAASDGQTTESANQIQDRSESLRESGNPGGE